MNTDAVKFVTAYTGGILLGTFGTALAINKLREKYDPNFRKQSYYPKSDYLHTEILNNQK